MNEQMHLHIDGLLDERQAREFEAWLAAHPEAQREYDTLLATKRLVASRPPATENPWFWEQLSRKIESPPPQPSTFRIPQRYLPAAYTLAAMLVIVLGVTVYVKRDDLARFFSLKSSQVQQAYEAGIKGWIMPLFAKTDKDDVLEFAMYGTLPLDRGAETVLRVDNTTSDGYRLEVAKQTGTQMKPVTTEDLYRTVRATPGQRRSIDSLLADAQHRIESSVLMNEDSRIAISATMSDLNTNILNGVASMLDGPQRVRFDRFLEERETPYTVALRRVAEPAVPPRPPHAPAPVSGAESRFVVITADEAKLERLDFDLDSIRRSMESFAGQERPHVAMHFETIAKRYVEKSRLVRSASRKEHRLVEVVEEPNVIAFHINDGGDDDNKGLAIQVRPRTLQRSLPTGEQLPQMRFRFFESGEGAVEVNIDSIVGAALQQMPDMQLQVTTKASQKPHQQYNVQMPVFPPPAPPAPGTGVQTDASDYEDLMELYDEYTQSRKEYLRTAELFKQKMKGAEREPELIRDIAEEYREQSLDMLSLQKAYQKALQEYQKKNTVLRKRK